MTAGVSYNTGRVGAVCGEYQKLKKHLEWALDRSLSEITKESAKRKSESGKEMKEVMNQLFESTDRLQENMRAVADRLEVVQGPAGREKEAEFGPPVAPTGPVVAPTTSAMTSATNTSLPHGILPPPAVPPMRPPMVPTPPTLPVVVFAGYSPAKMSEQPMTFPANLEVPAVKTPACQVIDEATSTLRCCSPTRRHNPATGTAAFAPLGYVVIKNTSDFRRLYP